MANVQVTREELLTLLSKSLEISIVVLSVNSENTGMQENGL